MQWEKSHFGLIEEREKDNGVEMIFHTKEIDYITRWLLMFSDGITIIEPHILKFKIKTILNEAISRI